MIIVTGACYTGTSLVAGTLQRLGIDMGSDLGNRYEDKTFAVSDLTPKILEVVANKKQDNWGFKYPFAYKYLDRLLPLLDRPRFIFCYRNLYTRRVEKPTKYDSNSIWLSIDEQAEWAKFFRKHNIEPLIIDFDISHEKRVAELCDFLQLEPTQESFGFYNKAEGYR